MNQKLCITLRKATTEELLLFNLLSLFASEPNILSCAAGAAAQHGQTEGTRGRF